MIKKAWAVWKGGIKDGGGTISTETGVLNEAPYGFKSRFENGKGTNPEELIGAAHAGCFSMALSLMLGQAGLTPERIETHAAVTLDQLSSQNPTPRPPSPEGEGEKTRPDFTSLLLSLQVVPGVFDVAYRAHRLRIVRSPTCLTCGTPAPVPTGEALDAAVDDALARLGAR